MKKLTYQQKLKIADNYLIGICGLGWDDLADINSLHDCETVEDIKEYCNDRLVDADFPSDILDEWPKHRNPTGPGYTEP